MAASLPLYFDLQFFTAAGAPASLHKLYTYDNGTNTPKTSYADAAGVTPNSNPIILNSAGRCTIYMASGSYSLELRDPSDVLVKRFDDISTAADATSAILADLALSNSATKGSKLVGHSDSIDYPSGVGLALQTRVFARDPVWAITGDGTANDTAGITGAMTRAVTLGVPLVLDGSMTHAIDAITIPAGLKLQTNGATLKDRSGTTSNTALITIGSNVSIDALNVSIPASNRRDRPIHIPSTNVFIGSISLTSVDQQETNTDLADVGIRMLSASDVTIGQISVTNYDRGISIDGCQRVSIGRFDCTSYVRGLYIHDSSLITVDAGHIRTASPNAVLSAGNNGVLIGCDTVGASHDITLSNLVVENSGEHGIRLGGPETNRNVKFVKPAVRSSGACGIKLRGTDGTVTIYNYNVLIDSPIIEDCGDSAIASLNRCGILAEWVAGLQIIAPVIRTRDLTYCASFGIMVNTCNDVEITSPTIHSPHYDGILLYAEEGDISRVNIVGGVSYNAGRNGLSLFTDATHTARNIHVNGILLQSTTNYGLSIANSGTISDAVLAVRTHSTTAGAVACASSTPVLQIVGVPGATAKAAVSASDGSTWLDPSAGNFYVMKAGTWTAAA